jgi:hypothetical protein
VTQLITASRLSAFRRCGRYHHLRYGQQLVPVVDHGAQRRWGSAMHRGLEAWWLAVKAGNVAGALEIAVMALDPHGELDSVEWVRAEIAMRGYHLRWQGQDLEVLAVEAQFDAPLVNPDSLAASRLFTVGGKIDAIVRTPNGEVWIVEHKTAGGDILPGGPYWQKLRLDAQVSTYMDGARALGYEPAGCIYDVIARPGEQLKLATPVESRKYTAGKGCKSCGGTHGGKGGVKQGSGLNRDASPHGSECPDCSGSGWFEAPRLWEKHREADETLPELAERIAARIAEAPDEYYMRSNVVRTAEEMVDARREMWASAKMLRFAEREGIALRSPESCFRFGSPCEYLPICDRTADATDTTRFRIADTAHPELAGV